MLPFIKNHFMSGRGDHNKKGTSGQGAGNQSGQGLERGAGKVNHGRETSGTVRSEPQEFSRDQSSNRDHSTKGTNRSSKENK
jgi:hypothetical protein